MAFDHRFRNANNLVRALGVQGRVLVTFLCGVFEPSSGRLALASAGHCSPVIMAAGQPPRWAMIQHGTLLGIEPGLKFGRTELSLHERDTVIFYTDGVTEAFNPKEECYGDERLLADAAALAGEPAPAVVMGLLRSVRAFAGTAPQSDDIAILALEAGGMAVR